MVPGLIGSHQLDGAQPPAITTRHITLHSPCLCDLTYTTHFRSGREPVEPLCKMGPSLNGSHQLDGAQPPAITTRHTPLDSPCLCKSNAANHASTGRELVASLCIMGHGLDGSCQLEGGQPPRITMGHTPLDSPYLCESNAANHASTGRELVESLCIMGPGLDGSRQLVGGQPPRITMGHTPLDSSYLRESNADNHASIGWELVELLCNMGPGLNGSLL